MSSRCHTSSLEIQRQGGADPTKDKTWTFTNLAEADAMIQRLLAAEPADDWRDTTAGAFRKELTRSYWAITSSCGS